MKKIIVLLVNVFSIVAFAQEKPFEGEIVYETFEHVSDFIKKVPISHTLMASTRYA